MKNILDSTLHKISNYDYVHRDLRLCVIPQLESGVRVPKKCLSNNFVDKPSAIMLEISIFEWMFQNRLAENQS